MAPSPLDKQPAGYKSPHAIAELGHGFSCFAIGCYVELKIAPAEAIWLFSLYTEG